MFSLIDSIFKAFENLALGLLHGRVCGGGGDGCVAAANAAGNAPAHNPDAVPRWQGAHPSAA